MGVSIYQSVIILFCTIFSNVRCYLKHSTTPELSVRDTAEFEKTSELIF